MKYLLYHSYYIGIALVFAAIISLLTGQIRWELLAVFSLLAYILRLYDDYCDYDTDVKKKLLDKKTLRLFLIIFCIAFLALNLIFFQAQGLICAVPLAYVFLENRFEIMEPFFLTMVSVIYLAMYTRLEGLWIILFLCGTLLLSTGFFVYKRLRAMKR